MTLSAGLPIAKTCCSAVSAVARIHATVFQISIEGGEPKPVPIGKASLVSFAPDGKHLAFTQWSWGSTWKRYRGGTAPDIYVGDLTDSPGKFTKIIDNPAVDQFPMWIGETHLFHLRGRSNGVANLYSCATDGSDVLRHEIQRL